MDTEQGLSNIVNKTTLLDKVKPTDTIRYRLNTPIADKAEFEERTALINIETGTYYSIWGEKARKVFNVLCEGATVAEIMEAFGPYSFVSVAEMKKDLENFIQQFIDFGIFKLIEADKTNKRQLPPLLYDYLNIEKHRPTQEKIEIHTIDRDASIEETLNSETIYKHLEQQVLKLINQNLKDFDFIQYKLDEFCFSVGYGSDALKQFFHPVIALNSTKAEIKSSFQIYVTQVEEKVFNTLRSLLNSDIERGVENFSFVKNGLAYQLKQINSEVLRKLVYWWDGTIRFYNKYSNTAYYICQQVDKIPKWEQCFSFRDILNWHFQNTNYQFVHGAGLQWNGKGVLLTAAGGSGKSTTTLYALKQGIKTLGDDFLIVDTTRNKIHSVYSIAKFRADAFDQLAEKEKLKSESNYYEHNQKYHLNIAQSFPNALVKTSSLDYIIIPIITGKSTASFVTATKTDALKAILLSTLYLLPGNKKVMSQKIKKMVEEVPTYFFYLSKDLAANPKALKKFLSRERKDLNC